MKLAIDVSYYQHAVPVKNDDNLYGVIIRTSDGINKDRGFLNNLKSHKRFHIGLYHFYRNNWNTDLQVKAVIDQWHTATNLLGYSPNIALDYEDIVGMNIVGRPTSIKRLYEFVNKVEEITKKSIWIYTSPYYWGALFNATMRLRFRKIFNFLTSKPLWLALYYYNDPINGVVYRDILHKIDSGEDKPWRLPVGFNEVKMWQFGKTNEILKGRVLVDVDYIYDDNFFVPGTPEPPVPPLTLEERVKKLEECCFGGNKNQ